MDSKVREISKSTLSPMGISLDYKNISIALSLPIKIHLDDVSIQIGSDHKIQIEKLFFKIAMLDGYFKTSNFFPDVEATLQNPKIISLLREAQNPTPPQSASPSAPIQNLEQVIVSPSIKNLKLSLNIANANIEINEPMSKLGSIKDANLALSFQSLQSPIFLNFSASMKSDKSPLPIWIPIDLKSQWVLQNGILSLSQSDLSVLAISTKNRGQVDLNKKNVAFQILAQITSLEKIPLPKRPDLPIKSWKGSLNSKINIVGPISQITYSGFLDLKNAFLTIQGKDETTHYDGTFLANIATEFQISKEIVIKSASLDLDLSSMQFNYNKIIQKPKNTLFLLKTKFSYNKSLNIDSISLKFAQLEASGYGSIMITDPKTMPGQISLTINPTNLSGLEKFILPLSQYPMTGFVSTKLSINGDLKNAAQSKIQINDLSLKNLSTQIKYISPDLKIEGPINLNMESKMSIDKLAVNSGSANLSSNLSGLKIIYKDLFLKNAREALSINLNAVQKNRSLNLKSSQIQTSAGIINFSGMPPISMTAPMNMTLDSKSLNLTKIRALLPTFQKQIPDGNVQFSMNLSGRVNADNFMKSPLAINLKLKGQLPKYTIAKSTTEKPLTSPPSPVPVQGFLPDEPLIRQFKGNVSLAIKEFEMDSLRAQGITLESQVHNGIGTSQVKIGKIFDGSVNVKNIKLSLLQKDPIIQFNVESPNLLFEKALSWALPQFQKTLSGRTQLKVQGSSKLPSSQDFMQKLTVAGNFKMDNGLLNVATIADMAKDLTAKIPGSIMDKMISNKPVPMKINGNFDIKNSKVTLSPFQAMTQKNEELYATGVLGLDMNVNMNGNLFLVDVGSGAFFEANKDAKGRLEIPIQIQGSALKPEFKFAQETISRMTQKTIQYEKTKLVQKTKAKVNQEVQKQTDKLKDNLKDKLKDIFK